MATLRLAEPWCRAEIPRLLAVFVAVTALAAQQRKLLTVHGDQPSFPDVVSTTWCSSGLRVASSLHLKPGGLGVVEVALTLALVGAGMPAAPQSRRCSSIAP